MNSMPKDIGSILNGKLSTSENERVTEYIDSLHTRIVDLGGSLPAEDTESPVSVPTSPSSTVPIYDASSGAEDYEAQRNAKAAAADSKAAGDYAKALDLYNDAVVSAPPSALLYSNRAICLMKLGNYKAAEKDCDRALELNPDSAKALKTRGKLRYLHLNDWHGALKDLSEAQSIDFDPDLVETLKELTKMRVEEEKNQAKERIDKENKMRKRAEEIRKAQEDEARDQKYHQKFKEQEAGSAFDMDGGMPGGGMPGMDMSGLMGLFMGDPEIQEAMKNPKVVAAFSELMSSPGGPASLLSDPAKVQKLMSDPEVGPVLQKILGKLGGAMPGGMGGMPGSSTGGGNDDDIPDLGNLPDLD